MATPEAHTQDLPPLPQEPVGGWDPVEGRGSHLSLVADQPEAVPPEATSSTQFDSVDNVSWPDTQVLADGLDKVLDKAQDIEAPRPPALSIVPEVNEAPTRVNVSVHRSAPAPAKALHRLGNGGAEVPIAVKSKDEGPLGGDKDWPLNREYDSRRKDAEAAVAQNVEAQKQHRADAERQRIAEWKEKRRQELVGEIKWARQSLGKIEDRLMKSLDRIMGTEEDEDGNIIPNERLDRAQQATKAATKAALKASGKASLKAGKWAGKEGYKLAKAGTSKAHDKWKSRHNSAPDGGEDDDTELDGEVLDNSLAEAWQALDSGDSDVAKEKLRAAIKAARAEDVVFGPGKSAPIGAVNPDAAKQRDDAVGEAQQKTPENDAMRDQIARIFVDAGAWLRAYKAGQNPDAPDWLRGGSGGGGNGGSGTGGGNGSGGSGNGGSGGGSGSGGGVTPAPVPAPGATGPAVPATPPATPPSPPRGPEAPAPTSPETTESRERKRRKLLKRAMVGAALLGTAVGGAMLSKYGIHINLGAYGHMLHINWEGWKDAIRGHFGGVHGGGNGNTVPEGFHQVHLTPGDTVWDETAKALGHQPTHDQVGDVLRDNGMQWSGGGPGVDAHDLPIGQAVNIPNNLGG